jgi:predicted permease
MIRRLFRFLKQGRGREAELREELDFHLSQRAQLHRQSGTPDPDSAARRQFGSRLAAEEATRETWRGAWLNGWTRDAAYALRGFRRSPAFFLAATATLALGIGAATAVFSVVDPLLFRPLPYPHDEQLISVGYFGPVDTNEFSLISSYFDWRRQAEPFLTLTSMRPAANCDLLVDHAIQVECVAVESTFLRTLGTPVQLGRDFTDDDGRPGAPSVALLSHASWTRWFGADPQILGRTVQLNDAPVRIIGVLSPTFEMPQLGEIDILTAARLDPSLPRSANSAAPLRVFGRLRGVSIDQARQRLEPLARATLDLDIPAQLRREIHFVARSLRDRQIQDVKLASWLLFGAVFALLGVALSNVANLLLARAAARTAEFAMRIALGASRARLIRLALTESLFLAIAGGAAGCAIAWALVRVFRTLAPEGLPRLAHAAIDIRVLLFATVVSLLAAILIGLWPALRPAEVSRTGARSIEGIRNRSRALLVSAQIAVSVVLLTGAILLLTSLVRLQTQTIGFTTQQVVAAFIPVRQQRYSSPQTLYAFLDKLEQRMTAIAGNGDFAISDSLPPFGRSRVWYSGMRVIGRPALDDNGGAVAFRWVTPRYFHTLQIPILAGRAFREEERRGAQTPVILSESLARRMFGSESPIGHTIELRDAGLSPIVGVVADAKNSGIDAPPVPEFYRLRMIPPAGPNMGTYTVVTVRTSLPPATVQALLAKEIAAIDPALPVEIATLDDRVSGAQTRPRFLASLVTLFATLAILLAAIGLYSVINFLVIQRQREIGIRLALGAQPANIRRDFLAQAARWTAAGLLIGLAASFALSRTLESVLFETSPRDPRWTALAIAILTAATVAASWLPSYRASRIDPARTLRGE